jgi:hypothetical protein
VNWQARLGSPTESLTGPAFCQHWKEKTSRQRPLYWQFNRVRADAKVAIRDGN